MTIFDIPANRLSDLDDEALREFVARLCEAERERQDGHRTDVRWGGAQTAPDGGLDVVVRVSGSFNPTPILPRRVVGIQVKKADLSRSGIETEMLPGRTLRKSIQELIEEEGAYLIVSVGVNCSEKMLANRRRAMQQAIGEHPNASTLHTDFIDRHALARWVGMHPSVAVWLRRELGLPTLRGWVGYASWSSTPKGIDDTLICDEGLTFTLPGCRQIQTIPEALESIRSLVRTSRKAIRITGLSGVGKTRLVQALFEQAEVGEPLPSSWAVYTDVGHNPEPLPLPMLETLVALNTKAILVIDNCPPDTHRLLAERLAKSNYLVKIITIEYDVRDDRPEETEVIRIAATGEKLIETLIRRRYPEHSVKDARRIAEIALGNARLAIALAAAAPQTGSLSSFKDEALFQRLFWQRNDQPEPYFAQSAEALSLVYSFDTDGIENPDELRFLSELMGIPQTTLYRHATALVERGLAQARGRWRAVLPHALANRLARQAICHLPRRDLAMTFGRVDATRLRRSFGRRLSYLHDLPEAREVVLLWMQPGGPLDVALGAAHYEFDLLEQVCHLVPIEALSHLQQLGEQILKQRYNTFVLEQIMRLFVRIAYCADHFGITVRKIIEIFGILEDREVERVNNTIEGLFGIFLSGTLARTLQRVDTARQIIFTQNPKVARYGLVMLRSALKTSNWIFSNWSKTDARPDGLGWHPHGQEIVDWYRTWIAFGEELVFGTQGEIRNQVRSILAEGVSRIWQRWPLLRDDIKTTAARLSKQQPWVEGWNAMRKVRSQQMYQATDRHISQLEQLEAVIRLLEPVELPDRARAFLCSGGYLDEEPEIDDERGYATVMQRHSDKLKEIGQELAARPDVIEALGVELFEAQHNNLVELGRGLGSASVDPMRHWRMLRDAYLSAAEPRRKSSILTGFLTALDERHSNFADGIRDECLLTPALRQIYAAFLPIGNVSNMELDRLEKAASNPDVWAGQFVGIICSDHHGLTNPQRLRLLSSMRSGKNGLKEVINTLAMLRYHETENSFDWSSDLCDFAINAIKDFLMSEDDHQDNNLDFYAAEVVKKCLLPNDEKGARYLVDALVAHASHRYGSFYKVEQTAAALAERSPLIFLDNALASKDSKLRFSWYATYHHPPLAKIDPQILVEWCQRGDLERWVLVAEAIRPFCSHDNSLVDGAKAVSLSRQAHYLLQTAPSPGSILGKLSFHITPTSWSGSRAAIMERRFAALEILSNHSRREVREEFEICAKKIRLNIAREYERERSEDQERDVSFE
ncbi:hypothetical protein [Acetobacter indonesiensis]